MHATREFESGFATIGFITASALALVLFAAGAHVTLAGYARAGVRAAAQEGVHRAVHLDVTNPVGACDARAREVVAELVRGAMGDTVAVACAFDGPRIVAIVTAEVGGWGIVPSFKVTGRATAVRER